MISSSTYHYLLIIACISASAIGGPVDYPPNLRIQGRAAKFRDEAGGGLRLGQQQQGKVSTNLGESVVVDGNVDPTFTPFISARVFNMPNFLGHLRRNLESMKEGEGYPSDESEFSDEFNSFGIGGEILVGPGDGGNNKGIMRWRPAPSLGRTRSRSNLLQYVEQPERNGYEFGLG